MVEGLYKITNGTKNIIKSAIEKFDDDTPLNEKDICVKIYDILEEKYLSTNKDLQLEKMNISNVSDVQNACDVFVFSTIKKKIK